MTYLLAPSPISKPLVSIASRTAKDQSDQNRSDAIENRNAGDLSQPDTEQGKKPCSTGKINRAYNEWIIFLLISRLTHIAEIL